jgi:hypothetical protein
MSTTAVVITQETARYSDNLLNKNSCFNYPLSWNIVDGEINGTASNSTSEKYNGDRSVEMTFTDKNPFIFNTGDDRLKITVEKTGIYALSWRLYKPNNGLSCNFNVRVYVNGVLYQYNNLAQIIFNDNGYVDNMWTCYAQYINLNSGDDVDFEFEAEGDIINEKLFFDGLKLEYNDRIVDIVSTYSLPNDIILEVTETIDVPIILSNDFEKISVTLTGAEVGDYVQMTYPSELITLGLIVGYPIVTNTDEVSFLIYNHTGASLNPASGTYTFKIVK